MRREKEGRVVSVDTLEMDLCVCITYERGMSRRHRDDDVLRCVDYIVLSTPRRTPIYRLQETNEYENKQINNANVLPPLR